ncbi:hypothetical protein Bhyg_10694 [Pseudolycoriella hygida]|uniref:Uncharacterized protein n=1 Tax=Pseudolycoriella hygida TaxID=35572 RepID=A0A9Q0RZH2_9DIPT|nr:hypothetical protein Bhyg_10694 [Pseudolycoriella hygida]
MSGEILSVGEIGKHAGSVNALLYDNDHVYSGGIDGVVNVWGKDLQFQREIPIHKNFAVLAIVANLQNHIYTCGRDGSLRYFRVPWRNSNNDILLQAVATDVTALFCVGNLLYSGDDKGIIKRWYNNRISCQLNVKKEVKSVAVDGSNLFTAGDKEILITDLKPDIEDEDGTKAKIPGRGPLILFGPKISNHQEFVVFLTRDGKGITLVDNVFPFEVIWTEENAHDTVINALCATDDSLFTAGGDGIVKKWKNLDRKPTIVETVTIGKSITALCVGPIHTVHVGDPESEEGVETFTYPTIYAADSEGVVRRLKFNA